MSYLTKRQIAKLNDKHGYFQHGDAQGSVSSAFAQDAIKMHESMRAAAPALHHAVMCYHNAYEEFRLDMIGNMGAFKYIEDNQLDEMLKQLDDAFESACSKGAKALLEADNV